MLNKSQWPETKSSAVDWIIASLDEKEKQIIRETKKADLSLYHFSLGINIRNQLGMHSGNDALMKDCAKSESVDDNSYLYYDQDSASGILIEAVWKRLRHERRFPAKAKASRNT